MEQVKDFTFIADPHFGLNRRLGVTPESAKAYALWQWDTFGFFLKAAKHPIVILGDLFNSGIVDYASIIRVADAVKEASQDVYVLQGNHDITKDSTKMSALEFLAKIAPVRLITEPELIDGIAFVPHMGNQEAFDEAIDWAKESGSVLVAHANYDNGFTLESDHSLNLTAEQALGFPTVILGHEHIARAVGNVKVLGSMVPTKVAEAGTAHTAWDFVGGVLSPVLAKAAYTYEIIHWQELDRAPKKGTQFIKIRGEASTEEAASALRAVTAFRKNSDAFMIQNAVTVEMVALETLEQSNIDLDKFDAKAAMLELITPQTVTRLKELNLC